MSSFLFGIHILIEEVNGFYPRTKIIAENLLRDSHESGVDVRIFRVDDILFESDVPTDIFHISNTVSEELKDYIADSNPDKYAEVVSVEDFLRNGLKLYESNDPKYDLFNELVIHCFGGGKLEDNYVASLIGFDYTDMLLEKMGFK